MSTVFEKLIGTKARAAMDAFETSSAVQHRGENGRAREDVLREFLQAVLPEDLGIGTGFVVDSSGEVSRQVDIVVYRRSGYPVVRIGDVAHLPVEAVVAVIESKADLGSEAKVHDALEAVASVKALDRTAGGANRDRRSRRRIDQSQMQDQVWSAVVMGSGLQFETCLEATASWTDDHERDIWPNAVLKLREYMLVYTSGHTRSEEGSWLPATSWGTKPMDCQGLGGIQPWGDEYPLIATLAVQLLHFAGVATPITFPQQGYFRRVELPQSRGIVFG